MIKYFFVILIAIPRIIYSQICVLIMNSNKKKYSLEKRYACVRKTICILNKMLKARLVVENVHFIKTPHQSGRIYVPNHCSVFEALALIELSEKPLIFISKIENSKIPFLAAHLNAIDGLYIDRKDVKQSLRICKQAGLLANSGYDVVIFAEGTRSKDGNVAEFKAALPSILHYAKCETYLICFHNSHAPLSFHILSYPNEIVHLTFFEPLSFEYFLENKKEFNQIARNTIQQRLDQYRIRG